MEHAGLAVGAPQPTTATPVRPAFRQGVLVDVPNMSALRARPDVGNKPDGNVNAPFERCWQVGAFIAQARQTHSWGDDIAVVVVRWWPTRPRFELMDRSMRRKYRSDRHAVAMALSKHINAGVIVLETFEPK